MRSPPVCWAGPSRLRRTVIDASTSSQRTSRSFWPLDRMRLNERLPFATRSSLATTPAGKAVDRGVLDHDGFDVGDGGQGDRLATFGLVLHDVARLRGDGDDRLRPGAPSEEDQIGIVGDGERRRKAQGEAEGGHIDARPHVIGGGDDRGLGGRGRDRPTVGTRLVCAAAGQKHRGPRQPLSTRAQSAPPGLMCRSGRAVLVVS